MPQAKRRRRILAIALLLAIAGFFTVVLRFWMDRNWLPPFPKDKRVEMGNGVSLQPDTEIGRKALAMIASSSHVESLQLQGESVKGIACRADIDGDGKEDLWAGLNPTKLVLWQSTTGRIRSRWIGLSGVRSAGIADVDQDGALDAWWCDAGDDYVGILWGPKIGSSGCQFLTWRRGISKAAFAFALVPGVPVSLIAQDGDPSGADAGCTIYPIRRSE